MAHNDKHSAHAAPAACCSHSFPSIGSATHVSKPGDNCFRPLFQAGSGGSEASPNTRSGAIESSNENDPQAEAVKESYERGMAAGNIEAAEIAFRELEPSLERFLTVLTTFSDNMGRLTNEYAECIVKLASAIAEKIVRDRPQLTSDEMLPLQTELQASLLRHYQLDLQINSADLKKLDDMMRCRNIELDHTDAVQICDSELVRSGAPRFNKSTVTFQELREGIAQAFESPPQAQASPSPKASTS